ncbi:hypothetical protein [Bdellovibrio sp. HCB209]|uniref:hypothetical protein n=1 Tax=Bdellovibrio sp. HCB209 TaxID=3394354 RepID=UPI0039B49E2C
MRLKRLLPFAVLAGCFAWSSHTGGLKFIPIYEGLTIRAQKSSPPHVAFEESIRTTSNFSEWQHFQSMQPVALGVEKKSSTLFAKKVVLAEMTIQKQVETVAMSSAPASRVPATTASDVSADNAWMTQLSRNQQARLQEAQIRGDVLNQDWQGSSWSEMAAETLERSGIINNRGEIQQVASNKNVTVNSTRGETLARPTVQRTSNGDDSLGSSAAGIAPGTGSSGYSLAGGASDNNEANAAAGSRRIVGPIEITGGLAVTNEHHIEVRRNDEGVLKELGRVDLQRGTYNIDVEQTTGTVVARLVNKDGKTLGEGSIRLNRVVAGTQNYVTGPKIKVEPHPDYSVSLVGAYNAKANDAAPAQTRVTFVKGVSDVKVNRDGLASMENVTRGSSTVMRAAAPKHLETTNLIISGKESRSTLYPETMVQALLDIISQQRMESYEGAPSLIWGKVVLDGKPVAGIDVQVETAPDLQPIYFNQFMMPDANLKKTSDNGMYAFIHVPYGFHSLLATRSNSIFGYVNVVAEEGAVAQGDLEATMKNESVPLRVFDAFTGQPGVASVTMQSLDEELPVPNGSATVTLPHLNRLGLMRVHPQGTDYIAARYIYNDNDEFVHVPLVRWEWLRAIKTFLKINEGPSTGLIVGFVPDEDFEVFLAGYDNFNPQDIVYFDMQGRILQNHKGAAGGGFIIYNVPDDTHEVVVTGNRTQKVYSRVVPVDANSLSVLNFRE